MESADQPPPQLPVNEKATPALNSPVKPLPPPILGSEGNEKVAPGLNSPAKALPSTPQSTSEVKPSSYKHKEPPLSPVKSTLTSTISDDKGDMPPPLPIKRG